MHKIIMRYDTNDMRIKWQIIIRFISKKLEMLGNIVINVNGKVQFSGNYTLIAFNRFPKNKAKIMKFHSIAIFKNFICLHQVKFEDTHCQWLDDLINQFVI